jgi:hypothetical protein
LLRTSLFSIAIRYVYKEAERTMSTVAKTSSMANPEAMKKNAALIDKLKKEPMELLRLVVRLSCKGELLHGAMSKCRLPKLLTFKMSTAQIAEIAKLGPML